MSSLVAARQNGEPHEDTVLDAYRRLACEGNGRLHPSKHSLDQRHLDER